MYRYFFCLAFLLLSTGTAFGEFFVIDHFDIQIRLNRNGYFDVTETIDVTFSEPRHGIFRVIPYRYRSNGERYDIDIDNIEVLNFRKKKSWENGNLVLRIGDPDEYVDGSQRYVISYRVKKAWLFEEEHTEFYWNLTGDDWDVPIEKTTFQIDFPEGLNLTEEDYRLFTGRFGEQGQDATADFRNGSLEGEVTRPLQPGEGVTVAVRLPVDYIERPSAIEVFLSRYGLLSLPLVLLLLLGGLWYRHGRDASFVKMVHYYPPADLSPAEAGAFIDDKTDNRDLIALIPYWAGQGFLRMKEVEKKYLLIFTDTDFEFEKLQSLPSDRPTYEKTIFNGLFKDGDTVLLSDLKNSFYKTMSKAASQLRKSVRNRQLHTFRSRTIWKWLPIAAVLCIGLGMLLMMFAQFPAGIATILTGLLGLILRRPMLKKNKQGMDVYQKLYGFRMFVDKADKDRIRRLLEEDPSYFEKTLPFAIAFGMTKKWTREFDDLMSEPPRWYVGSHAYHQGGHDGFRAFAGNFDSGMREVQSVFTSRPSSSGSGSGGFSGGSSGGGFGGGGGGSW